MSDAEMRKAAQALLTERVGDWLKEHRAWDHADVVELREAVRAALADGESAGPQATVVAAPTGQEEDRDG